MLTETILYTWKMKACNKTVQQLKVKGEIQVFGPQIPNSFSECLPLAAVAINTIYFFWLFLVQAIITEYHKLGDLLKNHKFISHSSEVWEA